MDKTVITNRSARHDYAIIESFEAGIELKGTEVKSLRTGKANLKDSFARVEGNAVYLYNMHISPYEYGNIELQEPKRVRKLLLHRTQIRKLFIETNQKGLTLVPLKVYFKQGLAKVELALAKGKRRYDKREDLKKRQSDLEIKRAMKSR